MTLTEYNDLGFKVLSRQYVEKLMGSDVIAKQDKLDFDPFDIEMYQDILNAYGFTERHKATGFELDKGFKAPSLLGSNIVKHFDAMAKDLAGPSTKIIRKILRKADVADLPDVASISLADIAIEHTSSTPWLKVYEGNGQIMHEYLALPDTDWLVLDFETFVQGSRHDSPIIGAAIGSDDDNNMCYYIWCHASLLDSNLPYVPVFSKIGEGKVVIMHNVAFDGALFEERYTLDSLNNWLFCTQAMNVAVSGLDGHQRWAKDLPKKKRQGKYDQALPGFLSHGCGNSLVGSYEFHTGKVVPDDAKDPRALFVIAKTIGQIADKLEVCLQYALNDVRLTLELFQALYPKYCYHVPSLTARIGQNMLANCVLPVRQDWHEWVETVEATWQGHQAEQHTLFNKLADIYHKQWQDGELVPEDDIWLKHLDWRPSALRTDVPIARWYENRAIFDEELKVTGKSNLAHYLLKLNWKGKPLQKSKEDNWHIITDEGKIERVVHRQQDGSKVGSVLTSYYAQFFEDGTITSADDEIGKRICWLIEQCSFYTIMRERVLAIKPVAIENPKDGSRVLLVAPRVNPHGCATGRITDNIWVRNTAPLASNS